MATRATGPASVSENEPRAIDPVGELIYREAKPTERGFQGLRDDHDIVAWGQREKLLDELAHVEWSLELLHDDLLDGRVPLWLIEARFLEILAEHDHVVRRLWPAAPRSAVRH